MRMSTKELLLSSFKTWNINMFMGADFERDSYSLLYGDVLKIFLCEIKP